MDFEVNLNVKSLRIFCFMWSTILAVIFFYSFFINRSNLMIWSAIFSLVFLILGCFFPYKISLLYKIWMKFAFILGRFNTKIIMFLFFFLIIVPVGFIFKIMGKDILKKKVCYNTNSYWEKRKIQPGSMKDEF